jgi:hypothetical protein
MAVDKLGQTNTLRFEMNRLAGRHRNHRRTRFGEDKNAGGKGSTRRYKASKSLKMIDDTDSMYI